MDLISLIWIVFGIIVFFGITVGGFFLWWNKVYKFKIRVFENVAGKGWEEVGVYRARKIKVRGSLADAVLYCPKLKSYVSAHGKKMGKNLYWFFIGPDGWLYNCVAGDLDAIKGILDIEPIDKDVRAFHTTNQKNINERYNTPPNWPTIVMSIAIILALIIVFAGSYVNNKQVHANLQAQASASQEYTKIAEISKDLLEAYVNLKEDRGSGLVPG